MLFCSPGSLKKLLAVKFSWFTQGGWGSQQAQHSLLPLEVFILRTANTYNDLKREMRDVM